MTEGARALAHRHNLVCEDGSVVCWHCRNDVALMPSLHCHRCLCAAREALERRREFEEALLVKHYHRAVGSK
jgi:hypothetical protein